METHKNIPSKSIPIGVSDFGKLTDKNQNYQFVDKSLLIQEVIDDASEVSLITRPRRWGKTLNLSMLEYFLSSQILNKRTQGLFDTLAIGQIKQGHYLQFQGQFPVILISFKDIKEERFDIALDKMRTLIQKTFRKYKDYLLYSGQLDENDKKLFNYYLTENVGQAELEEGLLVLSELLYRASPNQSVYILVDEYDAPLNAAYQYDYLESMTGFMKNLLSAALKDNPYLKKGILTGVLRISKGNMFSGLNNLEVHSVMNTAYASHFGFNDTEVKALFIASGLEHQMTAIRQYYNGYHIGSEALYNPWSIMECLKNNGVLQPYWVNTADDCLLRDTLLQATPTVKQQLQVLISGEKQTIEAMMLDTISFEDIKRSSEMGLWSLLVATGYLTPLAQQRVNLNYQCTLTIPNEQVKQVVAEYSCSVTQ